MMMRRFFLAVLLLSPLAAVPARAQAPLNVYAAASLTEAMQDISALWEKQGHPKPKLILSASSTLARQIEAGAPANLFASADLQWADYLDTRKLLVPGTRKNLLGNALVLIEPANKTTPITIDGKLDLDALLGKGGRLAVGDPDHVPAGIYAKQALTKLGLWTAAEPRLARTEDVRGALQLVARGEALAGIVYATDAAAEPGVKVAATFPQESYPPIIYPFAIPKGGDSQDAKDFFAFLQSAPAIAVFAKRGFVTE